MLANKIFRQRIQRVQKKLSAEQCLLVFAANHQLRNQDVEYKFRQDSNFYYLTGIDEADAVLFVNHTGSTIFTLPKNKNEEIWTGIRIGSKKAQKKLKCQNAYSTDHWPQELEFLLANHHTLFYAFGENPDRDRQILQICHSLNRQQRNGKLSPRQICFPDFLHEMRLIKSQAEIEQIQQAAKITSHGHIALMQKARPGMYEYQLQAILEHQYIKQGAWGGGYGHIVASGANATILHYTENRSRLKVGQLVLVDSGAEKDYYTADVSRVFPVAKKFSPSQKQVYEIVLHAQKKAIGKARAGNRFSDIHKAAVKALVEGLVDLGILRGSIKKNIRNQTYQDYYMHKTGHWLGMDVHDVGRYFARGKSIALQDGMVTTVEPGLYFAADDNTIPKDLRGLGIRIEDNIIIRGKQPINLTRDIPKEIDDIEALR